MVALYERFMPVIAREGAAAVRHPSTLVACSGRHEVFYIPFEHVARDARLAIVGITPGVTQLELAYAKTQELHCAGATRDELLREVKAYAAFGGEAMRPNLERMLSELRVHELVGVAQVSDLWGAAAHLVHNTSVVPHAAFAGGEMFAGSFEDVLAAPALRQSFERDFVPTLAELPGETLYVALGGTPLAALDHCVARGLVPPNRVLGALAHPSRQGGSQVGVYLGKRDPASLSPRDPVVRRVPWLLANAARMRRSVEALLSGRPVPAPPAAGPAVAPAPARPTRPTPKPGLPPASAATPGLAPRLGEHPSNAGLHVVVRRGEAVGTVLRPHIHSDGCYVVSPSRSEKDYIRVPAGEPLEPYLRRGLSLRMKAPGVAQSLISPASIQGRDRSG
jgi:hypothetical protein